ncbi:hypothetical protein E4L96_15405 [Massilia arenosa]|uniref:Lantibiotic dehydratase n=1 Tax=Zemynaea arenosa TaxID=2561931 RepID=A0A4Y9S6U1_9BURK|nr:lantibiotic dehydratase [Massilia arenosa]TFW16939.1 hypothetical protein E4L96_15405 [Massilia arenosa]
MTQNLHQFAGCAIHPRYVVRVAGEPVSALALLDTGETDALWKRAIALRQEIGTEAIARCAELESIIPGLDDKAASRAALTIKRAIFKAKTFDTALLDALDGSLPAEQRDQLRLLDERIAELAKVEAEILLAHDRELAHGSAAIGGLLEGRNMLSAISYTNPELYRKLTRHFHEGGAASADAKSTRNIEDSLLQYYARSSTKTSPLSSFTVIHVGQWKHDGLPRAWSSQYGRTLERRVEFKAGLIRHIMSPLFADFDVAAAAFPLALNRSIRSDGLRVRFHTVAPGQEVSGRTWGTGLTVAQLDANPVLQLVAHVYAQRGDKAIKLEALVDAVCTLAPKLAPEAVHGFVRKLYTLGYLHADTGLVEQRDILGWARAIAANPAIAQGSELLALLDAAEAHLDTMRGEDHDARAAAVIAVRQLVKDLATITGADQGNALFKTPFYENCYLAQCDGEFHGAHLQRYGEELELLQELSFLLDPNQQLHARMCDFFVARHGAGGESDDISAFLEAFDTIYAPGVLESSVDYEHAAPNSPRTDAWLRAVRAFDAHLDPWLHQDKDIELQPAAMRRILGLVPPSMRARGSSYSYVVQTAGQGEDERLVLNQVFGGRSSILSRFFETLDEQALNGIRDYVKAGTAEGRSVEMGGVFGFNANRHPAMSGGELDIAPFPAAFDTLDKVALNDLRLEYSERDHKLKFRDKDGKVVDVWYHGLLIPSLLPQLQRVLALGFTEGPSFAIVKSLVKLAKVRGQQVTRVPRISLGKVVLFRRTWLVAHAAAPSAEGTARDFYVAVREWQQRLGLPEQFFIRAVPLADAGDDGAPGAISWKDVNFKDMKPFYVDLRSPRFVRLMQNMMKRNSLTLCISELLPGFDSHPSQVEGDVHVSELHFELTRFAQEPRHITDWFAVRVAYFDDDRTALLDGPVRTAVKLARDKFGIERIFVAPHWKFGPHVDIVFHADAERFHLEVFPAVRQVIADWLSGHPSTVVLDKEQYLDTSRKVGMFELDAGPYLPLLRNNSITLVPYERPPSLVLDAFAESKEQMLSDSLDLLLELNALKADPGFFPALHAMLCIVAQTYPDGMREGYMSLRSHADYFFAAHGNAALRERFDAIDAKRREELDAVTRAVHAGDTATLPLAGLVARWKEVAERTAERNRNIVAEHYAELVAQNRHMELAQKIAPDAPAEFRERFTSRSISKIGEAFLNSEKGKAAQRNPNFLAYRTTVNFFYAILPILQVTPVQKFLLCHLVSNSVERVFGEDWRTRVAATGTAVEVETSHD